MSPLEALAPAHNALSKMVGSSRCDDRKRKRHTYQLSQTVLERIWIERLRQMQMLREDKHSFNCATAGIDPARKTNVLAEKLGEVAEAVDWLDEAGTGNARKAKEHLRDELTQLAACSIAWLEALEVELAPRH